jgi:hypothetical protein
MNEKSNEWRLGKEGRFFFAGGKTPSFCMCERLLQIE